MFSIKIQRVALISLLLLFVFTTLIASVPNVVSAAPYSKDNSVDKAKAWLFGRAVGQCFKESKLQNPTNTLGLGDKSQINEANAYKGDWFDDATGKWVGASSTIHGGSYVESVIEGEDIDGKFDCNNKSLVPNALELLGYGNDKEGYLKALCDMGFKHDNNRKCDDPNGGDFFPKDNDGEKLRDAWGKAWSKKYLEGKTMTGSLTDPMRFWIYSNAFQLGCGAKSMGLYTKAKNQPLDDYHYKVAMVEGNKIVENYVSIKEDANRDIYPGGDNLLESDDKINCKDLAEKKLPAKGKNSTLAKAFSNEMKKDETLAASADSSGLDGSSGEKDDECLEGKGNSPLSWFGCAALQMLDEALAWLDARVHELLFIDKNIVDSIKPSWVIFRNFAYIILIPLMLVMVIGTAVGVGIFDAYTVKKALPRMLAAVIFIALSFSICSFFINVTNIVGNGVGNILLNSGEKVSLDGINGAGSLTTGIFVAGVVYGFAGNITLGVIGSLALVSAVGLFIGLVTILLREILLVILVVLAPIAILVWIFPGNDKLWTMWKTTFIAMLMMYPLIVLLIASGQFLAGSLNNISVENGDTDHLRALIAMIAYVAPFFMIPATFKYGLGVFGNLAGMVNDKTRGFFDKQRKFRDASRQRGRQNAMLGRRFKPNSFMGRHLNRGIQTGMIAATGNAGLNPLRMGSRAGAYRSSSTTRETQELLEKNDAIAAVKSDDTLAKATQLGKNRAEIEKIISDSGRYTAGSSEFAEAVASVEAAQSAGSQGAVRAAMAVSRAASSTGYDSVSDMHESILQAAGGDRNMEGFLLAKSRAASESAKRFDLSTPGHADQEKMINELRTATGTAHEGSVRAANNKAARKTAFEQVGAAQILHGKPSSNSTLITSLGEEFKEALNNRDPAAAMETAAQLAALRSGMAGAPAESKQQVMAMFEDVGLDITDPTTIDSQLASMLGAQTHLGVPDDNILAEIRNTAGAYESPVGSPGGQP